MDQSLSESDAPSQSLSAVVVALMKGVLYQEQDTGLWQALLRLQVRVRDYVAVLGLELTLDESEGYAFLRSRAVADGEPELPRLVARRQLSFPVIHHFDDLNRAHEAVLKAKAQVERLTPLTADCERHAELTAEVEASRACRDALKNWFAQRKSKLLDKRLAHLAEEQTRLTARIGALSETKRGQQADERELRRAISESGGDRIDAEDKKVTRLRDKIIDAMRSYCEAYKLDTRRRSTSASTPPANTDRCSRA